MSDLPEIKHQIPDFDPFQAMDKLDDEAILAELEGRVVDTWVYHFPQEGKEIWGVSKVGIDQACREMAKQGEAIREEDVSWSVDPTSKDYVLFKASASRIAVTKDGKEIPLDRAMGTKRQSLNTVRRDGQTAPNPFWFEQGSIKALRNARARLVSEETRSKIIALAKEKGKVREVKEPEKKEPPKNTPMDSSPEAIRQEFALLLDRYCDMGDGTVNEDMYFNVLKEVSYYKNKAGKEFWYKKVEDIARAPEWSIKIALQKLKERVGE